MAFAVPLLEVALSILRRFLNGKPIFTADRGHIHHMLLKRGLTAGKAVVILYAVAILAAVFSVVQSLALNQGAGVVVLLFCAFVWLGVQSLGYTEFRVASRVFRSGAIRGMITSEIKIADMEEEILKTESPAECLAVVSRFAQAQGFVGMRVKLEGMESELERGITEDCWVLSLPLGRGEYLNLYHPREVTAKSQAVASLVDLVNGALVSRLRVCRTAVPPERENLGRCEITWGESVGT
jgi:UDP-GlcNAc:undecaprenyl-phosphate GlcNAc-1-phosphate transferase